MGENNNIDLNKFLEEMTKVRPEVLTKEAKKLFDTIMDILDRNEKLELENQKKDKVIYEMADALDRYDRGNIKYDFETVYKEYPRLPFYKCIIKYFERKVEEQE